ncbi:hypothetical protein KC845_00990 [Candidatus Kaiserbacteria bacterium]|nr:hypothetical protein [Candidatus Kaiserbacteria bacterium]
MTDQTNSTIQYGKKAVMAARQAILDEKPELLRFFADFDSLKNNLSLEERKAYTHARIEASVKSRVIFSSSSPEVESTPLPEDYIWVAKSNLPITNTIYIYNDTVILIDTRDANNMSVRTIKDSAYAENMKILFEYIWQQNSLK